MSAGVVQFLQAGALQGLTAPRLARILRDYYDEGSPPEIEQALQLLVVANLDVAEASGMLADSSNGAAGRGNPNASRCRTLLRVADMCEASERQGQTVQQAAETVGRFLEVSAGLEADIVIELLILAEVDDVVAVEHMFNTVTPEMNESSTRPNMSVPSSPSFAEATALAASDLFKSEEEVARRALEERVRDEAAAREHQSQLAAIKHRTKDAESRRPVTQQAVMNMLLDDPEISASIGSFMATFKQKCNCLDVTCEPLREFMDDCSSTLQENYKGQLMHIIKSATAAKPSEEDSTMLHSVIEDCLQTVAVMPVQEQLISAYKRRCAPADAELVRRQIMLRQQRQEFFGIGHDCITRDNWAHAVDAMSDLDDALDVTPNMRLKILSYVKVAIERCYRAELQQQGKDPDKRPLSADDILPIFAYVVANANVSSIKAITEYLHDVTAPGMSHHGEAAYYQCVLEAAIDHLLNVELVEVGQPSRW